MLVILKEKIIMKIHKFNMVQIGMKILIMLLFTIGYSYAQKALKEKLDDGTIRFYSVSDISDLTFEDDACDGVRKLNYSGRIYTTVQIGAQCWLKQNLNVGDMIQSSTGPSGPFSGVDQTDNNLIEKYCYNNDELYCNTIGGFYQWHEAMQYSTSESAQGICPEGWHIPTSAEFTTLLSTANELGNYLNLMTVGQGDGNSTNKTGFSALLTGYRFFGTGEFIDFTYGNTTLGRETHFWSSTEFTGTGGADTYNLELPDEGVNPTYADFGFSVRCIKN